jgi:hypothetical protein
LAKGLPPPLASLTPSASSTLASSMMTNCMCLRGGHEPESDAERNGRWKKGNMRRDQGRRGRKRCSIFSKAALGKTYSARGWFRFCTCACASAIQTSFFFET